MEFSMNFRQVDLQRFSQPFTERFCQVPENSTPRLFKLQSRFLVVEHPRDSVTSKRLPEVIPFRQLKSLSLTSSHGIDELLMMAFCTHLETLEINEYICQVPEDNIHEGFVALDSVDKFIVHVNEYKRNQFYPLWSSLTLPSLSILNVITNCSYFLPAKEWPWEHLHDFLKRSMAHSLSDLSLSFSGDTLTTCLPSLIQILRYTSKLSALKICLDKLHEGASLTAFHSSITDLLVSLSISPPREALLFELRKFHLVLREHNQPYSKVEIGKQILSFAASRSLRSLTMSGMILKVSPLSELEWEILRTEVARVLEKGIFPKFQVDKEDEQMELLRHVRELTAGGMACTIAEWPDC
ncbi:hypothetical protein VNI00_013400 [Paramarasmius palmivorus]|uniref:Uncharacterized protein n=1 Tax=Paramarasmius palmivorus TaxID=297713 RepID=A0AAW0C104_9AGAR